MPIKAEFTTQEEAPEWLREHVTEQDGKWVFEGETGSEVQRLKSTLDKVRKTEKEFLKIKPEYEKLQRFKDWTDEEVEAYQQWKEDQKTGNGKTPTESELAAKYEAQIGAREKKLKEQHAKELAERESQIQDAQSKLNNYVLDTEVASWGTKHKADPEARKALLKLARDHYRLDEKGNVIAVDEDGDPLPEKAEDHFASKFKSAHKYLFLSDETGGSGPNSGNADRRAKTKTISRAAFEKLTANERQSFFQKGGTVTD